jgi:hypothetical protein
MERIGGQTYHLALPEKYSRLHDVFPIQFLEDYQQRKGLETILSMPDLQDDEEEWEVQEVKGSKDIDGIQHYLVKWTEWPSEYDTWEPIEHLTNAKQKNKEWRNQIRNDNKPPTRKTRTQETLYPKKDEATNVKVEPATLFPEKDAYRCPQVF